MKYQINSREEVGVEELDTLFEDAEVLLYKKEVITTEDKFDQFERERLALHDD